MFLRSPLAAWFHIKLPSKRTKCSLSQPNFSKFRGEDAPGPPKNLRHRRTRDHAFHALIQPPPAPIQNPAYGPDRYVHRGR